MARPPPWAFMIRNQNSPIRIRIGRNDSSSADGLVAARFDQELLDLVELLDGLLCSGDIGEGDLRGFLVEQLRLGLAELHGPAIALGVYVQEPEQSYSDLARWECKLLV